MATTEFIAAIELGSSKITGVAGRKNSDGSMQVLAISLIDIEMCKRDRGMGAKDAVYLLESKGLKVNLVGVGKVKSQSIANGLSLIHI